MKYLTLTILLVTVVTTAHAQRMMQVGKEWAAPNYQSPYSIQSSDHCEGDMSNCISFSGVRQLRGYQISATVKRTGIEALGWLWCVAGDDFPGTYMLWRAEQLVGTQPYVMSFPVPIPVQAPCWIAHAVLSVDPANDGQIVYEVQALLFFD